MCINPLNPGLFGFRAAWDVAGFSGENYVQLYGDDVQIDGAFMQPFSYLTPVYDSINDRFLFMYYKPFQTSPHLAIVNPTDGTYTEKQITGFWNNGQVTTIHYAPYDIHFSKYNRLSCEYWAWYYGKKLFNQFYEYNPVLDGYFEIMYNNYIKGYLEAGFRL